MSHVVLASRCGDVQYRDTRVMRTEALILVRLGTVSLVVKLLDESQCDEPCGLGIATCG